MSRGAHLHALSLAASSGSPARASCRATSSNSSSTRLYAQSASSSVIRFIGSFLAPCGERIACDALQRLFPIADATVDRVVRSPEVVRPSAFNNRNGDCMNHSFPAAQWKGRDTSQQVSTLPGLFADVIELPPLQLADAAYIRHCSWDSSLRYAVQRSGADDYEVADDIPVSHSYMSKILKGSAGLHGTKLVTFIRRTRSLAPLQWLAEQLGCDVVPRDSRAAEVAALTARLRELEGARA